MSNNGFEQVLSLLILTILIVSVAGRLSHILLTPVVTSPSTVVAFALLSSRLVSLVASSVCLGCALLT